MAHARCLSADTRGTTLIEFAFVLPILGCLLYGILGYGQYFLYAHSVQQLANDAARATVAGLTAAERQNLANASVAAEIVALHQLTPALVSTTIAETAETVTVRVRFDASAVPLFRSSLIPMPDPLIERRAVVRPGGIS